MAIYSVATRGAMRGRRARGTVHVSYNNSFFYLTQLCHHVLDALVHLGQLGLSPLLLGLSPLLCQQGFVSHLRDKLCYISVS